MIIRELVNAQVFRGPSTSTKVSLETAKVMLIADEGDEESLRLKFEIRSRGGGRTTIQIKLDMVEIRDFQDEISYL